MAPANVAPSFTSDDRSNDTFILPPSSLSYPSLPMSYYSNPGFSFSPAVLPYPGARAGLDIYQGRDGWHTVPIYRASGQENRGASVQPDTRKWSPSPSFVTPYTPSGLHLGLMDMRSHPSLPPLGASRAESFSFHGTEASDIGLRSQAVQHMEPAPELGIGCFSPMRHRHDNLERFAFPQNSVPEMSLFESTEHRTSSFRDESHETQPSVALYYPQERKTFGGRRGQRASAISAEGLWIDKDDLRSSVAGQGSCMIAVHECQWTKSNNPCGMWIIGSRARIGAHIRKWHRHIHAASEAMCLWDGCTSKAMLKGSINRHILTVHLEEEFQCRGCNHTFSRKDVYDQHVEKGEMCTSGNARMLYRTTCRVIDACKALREGSNVRYAD